jgi:hypothetical protein
MHAVDLIKQFVLLMRFFCFMAIVYLTLHKIVATLSRKPDGRLLWFFDSLTASLTAPVQKFSNPDASNKQVLSYAIVFYAVVWLLLIFAGRYWLK